MSRQFNSIVTLKLIVGLGAQSHNKTSDASPSTSDQLVINLQVPIMPMFDNLLEQLTELRKALHLLLLVYYIGYNSGPARWKRCLGQECGEGRRASLPS